MSITVVIPTFNRATFLEKAIKSVLEQTYQDFTILISDNASTDCTKEIVNNFNDNRIIYYRHDVNKGMQQNWEFCLTNVKTEYLSFLESDNFFLPTHLERAMQFLRNSSIGFYFCNSRVKDSYYINHIQTPILRNKENINIAELILDINIPASGVVLKQKYVNCINFSKAKDFWCMDRFYWRSIILHSGFIFNPECNIVYVIHESNITYTLLKDKTAIAKASIQNRYVDAYTIYNALKLKSNYVDTLLFEFKQYSAQRLKHILPCFYTDDKVQELTLIGNELIDFYFSKKPVVYFKFLPFFLAKILIKKTNTLNSILGKYKMPTLLD